MAKYQAWTDGACKKTRIGGWGFVVVQDDKELFTNSGRCEDTTNNRMELQAAIEALKKFDPESPTLQLEVVSDSAYVVNCFKQKWYVKWRKNHWIAANGKEVLNRDLWEELLERAEAFGDKLSWRHVRGHSGHKWNLRADELATAETM